MYTYVCWCNRLHISLTCTGEVESGIPCIALSDNDGITGEQLQLKKPSDHDLLNAGIKVC
jgi:hypothetical protein